MTAPVLAPPAREAGPTITDMRPRVAEQLRAITAESYRRAYGEGVSLSTWLERQDPSAGYRSDPDMAGLDAFQRLLKISNIRVNSIPEEGVWADEVLEFEKDEHTRMLWPEFQARLMRRIIHAKPRGSQRAFYTSADNLPGGVLNQIYYSPEPVVADITPAVPLAQIIARTIGIRGNTYQAFYLTDVTAQERLVRVGEGAEIPRVKLAGGDHVIKLKKYGRVLEITYEELRRQRIDLLQLHMQQLAAQAEADKVAAAIDILVSGDGNSSTAATNYNLTALDSGASAGTLTLKGWLAFKMKFKNPYMLTTALAQEATALQMQLLNMGSANIPMVAIGAASGFGGFTPINPGLADNVALGWDTNAPSLKIVAFDRRMALLWITEIGSDITEIERWATRQTQGVVMSEVNGFATLQPAAVKTLNVNA